MTKTSVGAADDRDDWRREFTDLWTQLWEDLDEPVEDFAASALSVWDRVWEQVRKFLDDNASSNISIDPDEVGRQVAQQVREAQLHKARTQGQRGGIIGLFKGEHMKLSDLTGPDAPATITIDEAADVLGISRSTAYDCATSGEIPTLRLGRRIAVPVPALLEWLGSKKRPVFVVTPDELPELTPKAARLLLRILLEAAAKEGGE